MKADPNQVKAAALDIQTKGYSLFWITGTDRSKVEKALQKLCPSASVKYVFAGDEYFVDAKWWSVDKKHWDKFTGDLNDDDTMTPARSGVPRAVR